MTQNENNVLSTILEMTRAFQQGDLPAVMACYEKEATVVFSPGAPVTDPAVLRQQFMEMFQLSPRFEYQGHEVYMAGDTALHLAPWTMSATAPDGTKVEQRGLSVAVLRRQRDGRWLMVIDDPHGHRLLEMAATKTKP